ncbi:hypothetical protein [Deinococcus hopiensis]|uniref:Uncharacterized protein n=1 Tax=Deinococcus hopiensis KR-140 TaxID=695939 RepID=A0A1W1VAQ9_9DEIO|nr:hypothetical protein [Deinococcus hopiensis]SMB90366.1 hypothetical protein SAMN00790413_00745 [Deinococcus hopiensis KR-140]
MARRWRGERRFRFPLSESSGNLSVFRVAVKELDTTDLEGGSVWEGLLPARGWSHLLGARREPSRDFALTARTAQPAQFQRGSLYPIRALGGASLAWELDNVITAQGVFLTFTATSLRGLPSRLYGVCALRAGSGPAVRSGVDVVAATPVPACPPLRVLPPLRGLGAAFWLPVMTTLELPLAFLLVGHAGPIVGTGSICFAARASGAGRKPRNVKRRLPSARPQPPEGLPHPFLSVLAEAPSKLD